MKKENALRTGEFNFADRVFDSEMKKLINDCKKAYEGTNYKDALKLGFYDYQVFFLPFLTYALKCVQIQYARQISFSFSAFFCSIYDLLNTHFL